MVIHRIRGLRGQGRIHRPGRRWAGPALLAAGLVLGWQSGVWAADPVQGRKIYMTHCQNCHGVRGEGRLPGMPDFSRGEALLKPDADLLRTIKAGKGMMPAYQGLLSDAALLDVVAFLRTLR